MIAAEVRGLFADPSGQPSVRPALPGERLLPPDSISFRIHADVAVAMAGGIAALLLQMLHPAALAGVWDHSDFRRDMSGRLRRTAAFIARTTFGSRQDAIAAIERVRRIHSQVQGVLPDGHSYRADDPRLLTFVGLTEALSFLKAWKRYRDPLMPVREQDRYLTEMAIITELLGATHFPRTVAEAQRKMACYRPELLVDDRTREVARLLLSASSTSPTFAPAQRLLFEAAVDLLPGWARRMHGLGGPGLGAPLVRAGTGSLGAVIRWALAARR